MSSKTAPKSAALAPGRDASGRWVKGAKGRSHKALYGRSRATVTTMARKHTLPAIRFLASVMAGKVEGASVRDRVIAANSLLDRGWGRAPQLVALSSDIGHESESMLAKVAEAILAKRANAVNDGYAAELEAGRIVVDATLDESDE